MIKSTAACAVAVVAVLSGCSSTETNDGGSVVTTTRSVEVTTDGADDAAPVGDAGTVKYGQTYQGKTAQITIAKPVPGFRPSSTAYKPDGFDEYITLPVTIKATGKDPLDTTLLVFNVTSGDQASEEVIDSEKGLDGVPQRKLLPGRSLTFKVVYGYAPGKPLTTEVQDFGDTIVTYDGTV